MHSYKGFWHVLLSEIPSPFPGTQKCPVLLPQEHGACARFAPSARLLPAHHICTRKGTSTCYQRRSQLSTVSSHSVLYACRQPPSSQHLDNLRRKNSLRGAETREISARLGNYSASHFGGSACSTNACHTPPYTQPSSLWSSSVRI